MLNFGDCISHGFFLHPKGGAIWGFLPLPEASEATITDERYNRRVEEEAISKLERLGYPRNWERQNKERWHFFFGTYGFRFIICVRFIFMYIFI